MREVCARIIAIADTIKAGGLSAGGGGTVDQTARDMAEAAQNTANGKEPSLGNFTPEVPPRRRYLSAIFDQYNPPSYRATSWEPLPAFLENATQVTPTAAVQNNFSAWVAYQRPSADPGGVRIGKFETTATIGKPDVFLPYTKFYTIMFHTSQYGSGRDSYQRGSGWVFAYNDNGFGPYASFNYDTNGYGVGYKTIYDDSVTLDLNYSTSEKLTGKKWIDGTLVYSRCFEWTSVTLDPGQSVMAIPNAGVNHCAPITKHITNLSTGWVNKSGVEVLFIGDGIYIENNTQDRIDAGDQWVFIFEYIRP
jgi:hypothetical protein